MYHKDVVWEIMDWIHLAEGRYWSWFLLNMIKKQASNMVILLTGGQVWKIHTWCDLFSL
jgi:hypothetical protein